MALVAVVHEEKQETDGRHADSGRVAARQWRERDPFHRAPTRGAAVEGSGVEQWGQPREALAQ